MPQLSRATRKLLHTVDNRQYATTKDHVQDGKKGDKPVASEDILASPESSSAEDDYSNIRSEQFISSAPATTTSNSRGKSQSQSLRQTKAKGQDGGAWANEPSTAPSRATSTSFLDNEMQLVSHGRKRNFAKYAGKSNIHAVQDSKKPRQSGITSNRKSPLQPINPNKKEPEDASSSSTQAEKSTSRLSRLSKLSSSHMAPPSASTPAKAPSRLRDLAKSIAVVRETSPPRSSADKRLASLTASTRQYALECPSSPLSSPPASSPAHEFLMPPLDLSDDEEDENEPDEARCPMCFSPVDAKLLHDFRQRYPNMDAKIRLQRRFCGRHRRIEAEELRREKGYPVIDWDRFPDRLHDYDNRMQAMIEDNESSECWRHFSRRVREGKISHRWEKLAEEDLARASAGYYGPRGMEVMTEHILSSFNTQITTLSQHTPLIRQTSTSLYAQFVLVPELACLLVMDDLDLADKATAMGVLRESMVVGDVLNAAGVGERRSSVGKGGGSTDVDVREEGWEDRSREDSREAEVVEID